MLSKRTRLAVLCAAALVACEAADSVTGPSSGPSLMGGTVPPIDVPPVDKPPVEEFLPGVPVLDPFGQNDEEAREFARGYGQFHVAAGTALRTFRFVARTTADGTTSGQYQVDNQAPGGSRENGTVTCLEVVGNEAWIGGVITHSSFPGREGTPRVFRVVDRGDGTPPDQASLLEVGDATLTCQTRPPFPLENLESGKIQVRDGGGTGGLLP